MKLDFKHFKEKAELLGEYINPSPLVRNTYLSRKYQANIYLKLENLLPIGSFKLRGALSKMLTFNDEEKQKTVLAVSAGNHAQGVAWAARELGMKVLIIMPKKAPLTKRANTQDLGAEIRLIGDSIEECFEYAEELLKKGSYVFIHPYLDEEVITGQGSIAFELMQQLPKVDYIFSAIGGGGLTTGIAFAMNELNPKTKVIGSQAEKASALVKSVKTKKYVSYKESNTFADGVKVIKPEPAMIKLIDKYASDTMTVSDTSIALSVLALIEKARVVVEGAGAISLSALEKYSSEKPDEIKGKNIVLIISGGNIDLNLMDKIIDKGLTFTGRRLNFSVLLKDEPGALLSLIEILKNEDANILQVEHDHKELSASLLETLVHLRIEVKDKEHGEQVLKKIKENFAIEIL